MWKLCRHLHLPHAWNHVAWNEEFALVMCLVAFQDAQQPDLDAD